MNDMQEHMRDQYRQQQQQQPSSGYKPNTPPTADQAKKPVDPGDYIEFEESK